jgi:hypothetical protein
MPGIRGHRRPAGPGRTPRTFAVGPRRAWRRVGGGFPRSWKGSRWTRCRDASRVEGPPDRAGDAERGAPPVPGRAGSVPRTVLRSLRPGPGGVLHPDRGRADPGSQSHRGRAAGRAPERSVGPAVHRVHPPRRPGRLLPPPQGGRQRRLPGNLRAPDGASRREHLPRAPGVGPLSPRWTTVRPFGPW